MSDDEFLTVDEVAALLKVNPQTVRNTIDRGDLQAVRFGRRVRVRRVDLDNFIEVGGKQPSERRVTFDDLSRDAAVLLRRGSPEQAAAVLRELSAAALALADEL